MEEIREENAEKNMERLGCVSCVRLHVLERQGTATKRGRAYRAVKHAATFVDLELAWSKQFPILCTPVEIASCHVLPWGYNTRTVKCIEAKRAGESTLSPSRHASARTVGDDGVHHAQKKHIFGNVPACRTGTKLDNAKRRAIRHAEGTGKPQATLGVILRK